MKFKLPSQVKLYQHPDGWMSKETADGHNAWYHQSLFSPKKWYDQMFDRAGMATVYSDAWTKVRAGRMTSPATQAGVVRALIWDFAILPAGNIADVLVLGKLYAGDRCIGGIETHSALTSGGGTATGSYGTYDVLSDGISLGASDSAARFMAAVTMEAANTQAGAAVHILAISQALGYGYTPTTDKFLVLVNSSEAFATAGVVSGHMNVVRT